MSYEERKAAEKLDRTYLLSPLHVSEALRILGPNGENWCQGEDAMDNMGLRCNVTAPEACQWCCYGAFAAAAMRRGFEYGDFAAVVDDLNRKLGIGFDFNGVEVGPWNDDEDRTFGEVREAMMRVAGGKA